MTPAERARLIDKQEFEAECRAALERALAYSKQCRDDERRKVNVYLGKTETAPVIRSASISPDYTKHTIDGQSRTTLEWARYLGITIRALLWRCQTRGSLEAAVAMGGAHPPGRKPSLIEFEGTERTIKQWAELSGLEPVTIHNRLRQGWSVREALTSPSGARRGRPGVSSNFAGSKGTGAGSTVQETPNITFSEEDENA
jgi:hypothetical protein